MGSCLSTNCRCYCNNNNNNSRRRSNSSQNSRNYRANSSSNNFSSISINDLQQGQQNQHTSSPSNRPINESQFMNILIINDSISSNSVPTGRNKRLKKDKWKWRSDLSLTEDELEAKRDEFWDTQPAFGGRVEIWNALKAVCNAIDTNQNYELAQAIIDSAQIILPNGTLNDCYDELGNHYQLPNYVIMKPVNLKNSKITITSTTNNNNNKITNNNITSTLPDNTDKIANNNATCDDIATTNNNTYASAQPTTTTTENTATTATTTKITTETPTTKQELQLKFRLSNNINSNDLKLIVNLNQSIFDIKQKIHELKQIEPQKQRLYFGGKLLVDRFRIKDLKLEKNFVIQVIVREDQQLTS